MELASNIQTLSINPEFNLERLHELFKILSSKRTRYDIEDKNHNFKWKSDKYVNIIRSKNCYFYIFRLYNPLINYYEKINIIIVPLICIHSS